MSKLIEAPGDPHVLATLLHAPDVDPAGLDSFANNAILKVSAWNKPELIELLLPHLTDAELNATAGADVMTPLHMAVVMGAHQSLQTLLDSSRFGPSLLTVDASGQTPLQLARSLGDDTAASLLLLAEDHGCSSNLS